MTVYDAEYIEDKAIKELFKLNSIDNVYRKINQEDVFIFNIGDTHD